jgi:hypothetical protein
MSQKDTLEKLDEKFEYTDWKDFDSNKNVKLNLNTEDSYFVISFGENLICKNS